MRLALASFGLFLLTCVLVAAGAFTWLDQYAVSHLMPGLDSGDRGWLASLTLPDLRGTPLHDLVDVWTWPASFVPSGILAVLLARALRDAWPVVLWVAGNLIEVIGKAVVSRPALYDGARHVTGFDHGVPSGHTIRALVLAGAAAALWRWGRLAYVWAATAAVALVPLGAHAPTDVVAGAFVGVALLATASFRPSWRLGP